MHKLAYLRWEHMPLSVAVLVLLVLLALLVLAVLVLAVLLVVAVPLVQRLSSQRGPDHHAAHAPRVYSQRRHLHTRARACH